MVLLTPDLNACIPYLSSSIIVIAYQSACWQEFAMATGIPVLVTRPQWAG